MKELVEVILTIAVIVLGLFALAPVAVLFFKWLQFIYVVMGF